MSDTKKCAHPICSCQALPDSAYCCTYCEGEAKTTDIVCNCGHRNCVTAQSGEPLVKRLPHDFG